MPPDVRKASGLPAGLPGDFGLRPVLGPSPDDSFAPDGSAERFRTSGGKAATHFRL